jgi:hypothetical protein
MDMSGGFKGETRSEKEVVEFVEGLHGDLYCNGAASETSNTVILLLPFTKIVFFTLYKL